MWISLNEAGSIILDFDELKFDLTFLNEAGVVRDRFTLLKRQPSGWSAGRMTSNPPPRSALILAG